MIGAAGTVIKLVRGVTPRFSASQSKTDNALFQISSQQNTNTPASSTFFGNSLAIDKAGAGGDEGPQVAALVQSDL